MMQRAQHGRKEGRWHARWHLRKWRQHMQEQLQIEEQRLAWSMASVEIPE